MNAPAFTPFNGDPWRLFVLVNNSGRIRVLAPGEAFTLARVRQTRRVGQAAATSRADVDERSVGDR
jgi:hypothetical protein